MKNIKIINKHLKFTVSCPKLTAKNHSFLLLTHNAFLNITKCTQILLITIVEIEKQSVPLPEMLGFFLFYSLNTLNLDFHQMKIKILFFQSIFLVRRYIPLCFILLEILLALITFLFL